MLEGATFKERVKGIEPSYAAWEAAVLPLNYTREEIFDFSFAVADCNRNKFAERICCSVRLSSAHLVIVARVTPLGQRTLQLIRLKSLPRNHVVGVRVDIVATGSYL